jgi:epoxyqueuosine reductase
MLDLDSIFSRYGIKEWGLVNDPLASTYDEYQKWLSQGNQGILSYLEGDRALTRESLKKYFPKFKSALVFAFDYSRVTQILEEFYQSEKSNGLKIASYALAFDGSDYHYVLKDLLNKISEDLKKELPPCEISFTLDTQPVLERDLAKRAGLGWFGKNSMMINRNIGSFFIIGSLLLDVDLSNHVAPAKVETDHCGQCTRCVDACPTDALIAGSRTLVADKCISTFTIEQFKEAQAPSGMEQSRGEIYGCDICQVVCPWNKRVLRQANPVKPEEVDELISKNKEVFDHFLLTPVEQIISFLESISNRAFRKQFAHSPISRTGRIGLLKNIKFFKK